MANLKLKRSIAFASVAVLLLIEFSFFPDFFQPFRLLWDQGRTSELFLSLLLFCWSLLAVFLIFFSGRSLLRKITLPFFLFFFLFNIDSKNISNALIDFQMADMIVGYFQWWFWEVVENYDLAALPFLIILIPVIIFVERLPALLKLNIPERPISCR